MVSRKFNRRIVVETPRKTIRFPEVDIEGVINFSERWADDVDRVRVFNIEDPVVDALVDADVLTVRAGHKGDVGIVREGLVRQVVTETRQGDRVVEITISSGIDRVRETFVSQSFKGRVTPETLVEEITENLDNIETGFIDFPEDAYYPNKVLSTTAYSALDQIAKDFGRIVYLKDLRLNIEEPGYIDSNREMYVNRDNGLKEVPRTKDRKIQEPTFTARMILSHLVEPGRTANVNEDPINGIFRVVSGRHSLTDFETTAVLEEAKIRA